MSELITPRTAVNMRLQLLATVSALSLLTAITSQAKAEDSDRPTIWIELGGQLERVDGGQGRFSPPFVSQIDTSKFVSPLDVQHAPRYGFGGEGKISFEPQGTDWVFLASVRYGRSNGSKSSAQNTVPPSRPQRNCVVALNYCTTLFQPANGRGFSNAAAKFGESHAIFDFQAGKDVGLGLLGRGASSTFDLGIRIAQFTSTTDTTMDADQLHFGYSYKYLLGVSVTTPKTSWQLYRASEHTTRNFRGIGPSLAWDASAPIVGQSDDEAVTFDWGVNAAVLFGRQKVKSHHKTVGFYRSTAFRTTGLSIPTFYHRTPNVARSRTVVVPNIGGFAGFSLKFPNAKVSMGYRADFFFGAMDGGIDTRKIYDRSFYGPFATVSIGLGG